MVKKIAAICFLMNVLISLLLMIWLKNNTILTAFVSNTLLIVNLIGIYWLWKIVVQKKSIALGGLLIILKYPLLGYVVALMIRQNWFDSFGIFIGFLSFVFSIVLVTVFRKRLVYASSI